MSIIKANGAGDQSLGFYNGVATQSLRFDDGSSTELSRTFVTPTNQNRWTLNVWVKRALLDGVKKVIIGMPYLDTEECFLGFDANNKLEWQQYSSGGATQINELITTQVFRDTSSWYNIHAIFDSAGSGDDRQQLWVNGVKITSYSTETRSAEDSVWNKAKLHYFGNRNDISTNYFDGYMSEINFVDGLALDPSYFGETKNGVWIAKTPVVSDYGNNGFRLQFANTGEATTSEGTTATTNIGDDSSGSGHNFAVNNIDDFDCVPDSPENNFSTLNALDNFGYDGVVLSEGNLKGASTQNHWDAIRSTFVMPTGSWYVELLSTSGIGNGNTIIGIIPQNETLPNQHVGVTSTSWAYASNGNVYNNGSTVGSTGATFSATDIVAMTFDGSTVKWYKNNSLIHTVGSIPSAEYSVGLSLYDTDESCILNFGQDPTFAGIQDSSTAGKTPSNSGAGTADSEGNGLFFYAPPSGFLALCSANLSDDNIPISPAQTTQAVNHMGILTYTGTDADDRTITSGDANIGGEIDFTPDWVWVKARNASGNFHLLFDSPRGATKFVYTNDDAAEVTQADSLSEFNTNGFTVSDNASNADMNASAHTYVAWNWKAGGAPSADNSAGASAVPTEGSAKIDGSNATASFAGTIPVTRLSANTISGFSIVTYTGTGSGGTINHGLSSAPDVVIVKNRDRTPTLHTYYGSQFSAATTYQYITGALANDTGGATITNSAYPASTVFSVGSSVFVNANTESHVAYCFHSVEGYSKFGTYTGNAVADGTFVYLGFRPAWLMVKSTAANNWHIWDTTRGTFNPMGSGSILLADLPNDEASLGSILDILSNGFKARANSGGYNSAVQYIYMAFAEAPFKYANAR